MSEQHVVGQDLAQELLKESNFPKRLKFARLRQEHTHITLAHILKVSQAAPWHWEQGKTKPVAKNMKKIAKALRVNIAWLKSGVGEMDMAVSTGVSPKLGDTPAAKKLVEMRGAIGPDGMTQPKRIVWARTNIKMAVPDLAKAVGLGYSTLGAYTATIDASSYRAPPPDVLDKLAEVLQVNRTWLENGTGRVSADVEKPTLNAPIPKRTKTTPPLGMNKRLHDCAIRSGLTSTDVGQAVGQGAQTFCRHSTLVGEVGMPYDSTIRKYARLFGVPYRWIKTGTGPGPKPLGEFDFEGFPGRFIQALEVRELSVTEAAELNNQSYITLKAYLRTTETGRPPIPVVVGQYANALDIRFDWLWDGTGEMLTHPIVSNPVPEAENQAPGDQNTAPASLELEPAGAEEVPGKLESDTDLDDAVEKIEQGLDLIEGSPSAKYFTERPEATAQVRMVTLPKNDLGVISARLQNAIDKRDDHLRLADLEAMKAEQQQQEIDRWTAVLLAQVS